MWTNLNGIDETGGCAFTGEVATFTVQPNGGGGWSLSCPDLGIAARDLNTSDWWAARLEALAFVIGRCTEIVGDAKRARSLMPARPL